jgi:ElaB/YqjD/DUF883 family membrane-anchored ribosome-binding protein
MDNRFSSATGTMDSLASTAKSTINNFGELKEVIMELKERLAPYLNKEKAREVANRSVTYVKQHPTQIILAGIGIGLLASYLLTRGSWRESTSSGPAMD